ncbi:cytochrome P450 [Streptomyces sp. NPDC059003]|uniref:cytochrome P450 n=1 Tax=Streptomyces sp. NPDC059003 TaxID=3346691 RepID=UPI0036A8A59F
MTQMPMPATEPELPLRYPFEPGPWGTPPLVVHWARRNHPVCPVVLPSGTQAWMLTRKDDIAKVFADRRFSRALAFDGAPRMAGDDFTSVPGSVFNIDPPDHTRVRQVIAPYYTRTGVQRHRPMIEDHAKTLLDKMASGLNPADLVETYADPLPPLVTCDSLKIPTKLRAKFMKNFKVQTNLAVTPEKVAAATKQITAFTGEVVAARREDGDRDDPIGALITAHEQKMISEDEVHGTASYLCVTGVEALVSPLLTGPLTLLRHPKQLRECMKEPELWPKAVEELLRYHHNGVLGLPRIALEDVELHGTLIRNGDAVCATMLGATWDEAHYPNPAKFDIHRTTDGTATFGAGPHFCIGAAFARLFLQIACQALFTRFPTLRLALAESRIPWREDLIFIRPSSLPVTW